MIVGSNASSRYQGKPNADSVIKRITRMETAASAERPVMRLSGCVPLGLPPIRQVRQQQRCRAS